MHYTHGSGLSLSAIFINLLLICIATVALTANSTIAKYVLINRTQPSIVQSSKFFFTSNYLAEDTPARYVYDIGGASVRCFNYDVNNTANTSQDSVTYDVKLTYLSDSDHTVQKYNPKDINGNSITTDFSMKIEEGTLQSSEFNVPFCPDARYVLVEATSSAPYRKSISANMRFDVDIISSYYTLEWNGNIASLSISVGTLPIAELSISWPEGYIPDSTSSPIADGKWQQNGSEGVLTLLSPNTVYKIDFIGTEQLTEVPSPTPFTDKIVLK